MASPTARATARTLELPPVPTPSFGGNIWEWEQFWEIFNTNVHSQEIPEMIKKDNYSRAIQFLLNKYNNEEALINNLVEKLDGCTLRGQTVGEQRHLLEELQVIVAQLTEKGEEVNSAWIIKKVLTKFPDEVKRKVIAKKQQLPLSTAFTMEHIFKYVDEILSTEEAFLIRNLLLQSFLTHPCVPIGELTAMDHETKSFVKIQVLLDTGAEMSFIDEALAQRLHLPVLDEREIQFHTFGSQDTRKSKGRKVYMEVWDADGTPYSLQLLTHDVLTHPLVTPSLPTGDIEFIKSLNLPIKWKHENKRVKPSILLGCDHLWSFVRSDEPSITLPSGIMSFQQDWDT
ncbi:unnamed protein product [Heligmosomoides polygyrus]|uniref:Peptidase A2 domain-containing protein n=1 Tax=Heligmosomoides polygyrus TaxID=6339 RepID=A0A183F633_HELPZ|nr:unnamed protein product [Heligmosomoides polygyrus]